MRRASAIFVLVLVAVGVLLLITALLSISRPRDPADWVALVAIFGGAVVFLYAMGRIGVRMLRPEAVEHREAARPDRRPPVAPVTDTELTGVPEPVTACPDCGYLGIRMLTMHDGVALGGGEIGDKMTCPRCGYQGLAIHFAKRADYGDFLRGLSGSG